MSPVSPEAPSGGPSPAGRAPWAPWPGVWPAAWPGWPQGQRHWCPPKLITRPPCGPTDPAGRLSHEGDIGASALGAPCALRPSQQRGHGAACAPVRGWLVGAGATPEGPAARREKGAPPSATTWMDVEGITLREIRPAERQKPHAVADRRHLKKKNPTLRNKVVSRGQGWGQGQLGRRHTQL